METKRSEAIGAEGIDLEFVENILQGKVLKFTVDAGSNPGDNFLSRIYSIDAVLAANPEHIIHFLIKAYPALAARQAFLNRCNVFLKEIQVYRDFIPALIEFQEGSAQIIRPAVPPFLGGKAIDFASDTCPEISGAVRSLDNYLAMVDIRRTWGYKMASKTEGLDEAHIKLVITELARFHALGWAYKERNHLSCLTLQFPFLKDTMMTERGTDLEEMVASNFQLIQTIAKKYFPEDSKVVRGVQRLIELDPMNIMEAFLPPDGVVDEMKLNEFLREDNTSLEETSSEPWTTLCHGDCWVNNMLFRYKDENCPAKPTDVIFVDLQIAHVGCPTTDLAYLLFTSTTADVRKKNLMSLLQLYHDTFLDTCQILKVEPLNDFSMKTLLAKFRRARIFGFTAACLVLPIILCENCPDLDVDNSKGDGETPKNMSDVFSNMMSSSGENQELERRFVDIFHELVEENIF